MATPNYDINYNDKRFTDVEADKKAALNQVEQTYGGMINEADKYYQAQINAAKNWGETQKQNQQAQTDFAIEKIEQQKDQAKQDYLKEQSGAYADWQKQSNQYGANAEQVAAQGLANTGYSESSQVAMYNQYQNRVATSREVFTRAVLNYDNAMKDARLQNNSKLAEIAYQTLQTELELGLQGFQYKNNLLIEQSNKKLEVDNMYYGRYQDVLQQINTENAFKEQIRQYEQNYDLQVKEYEEGIRQFNEEIARLKAKDAAENAAEIQRLELQKAQLAEEKRQFDATHGGSGSINKGSSSTGKGTASSGKKTSTSGINKNSTPSSNLKADKATKVNMQSVINLGYGPISESRLDELVRQGVVKEYIQNGQFHYKKTVNLPTSSTLNLYMHK
jgi:hypothetical protein